MNSAALNALALRPTGALLTLAPLSDTGTSVPVGLTLQAPSGLLIHEIALYAPENPESQVLRVVFAAAQAPNHYRLETRIRLGASQDIWLVSTLSDGSLMGSHAYTVLTSSACFDAS